MGNKLVQSGEILLYSNGGEKKFVSDIYAEFRKKQDADYISEFDRQAAKYLKGGEDL